MGGGGGRERMVKTHGQTRKEFFNLINAIRVAGGGGVCVGGGGGRGVKA